MEILRINYSQREKGCANSAGIRAYSTYFQEISRLSLYPFLLLRHHRRSPDRSRDVLPRNSLDPPPDISPQIQASATRVYACSRRVYQRRNGEMEVYLV